VSSLSRESAALTVVKKSKSPLCRKVRDKSGAPAQKQRRSRIVVCSSITSDKRLFGARSTIGVLVRFMERFQG
jgi:hypothetical protein